MHNSKFNSTCNYSITICSNVFMDLCEHIARKICLKETQDIRLCRKGCQKAASASAFDHELEGPATLYITDGKPKSSRDAATIVLSSGTDSFNEIWGRDQVRTLKYPLPSQRLQSDMRNGAQNMCSYSWMPS